MHKHAAVIFAAWFLCVAPAFAEDLAIPSEYQGQQIQVAARFDKPAGVGPFPVVIMLHTCSGAYAANSLPAWSQLLQSQGYAILRPDSFTARGVSDVCADNRVTAKDRAQDVLAAAYTLAARPDVKADRIAVVGMSHGGGGAVYVTRDHEELRPWRERLGQRRGKLVASVSLYGSCGNPNGYPVIIPLLALSAANDDWTPAAPCVALANAQQNGIMQIQVYPEAYHAFDAPIDKPFYKLGHRLAYDPAATADARIRATEFLRRYLQ
jgi:dienelactone hydrolase